MQATGLRSPARDHFLGQPSPRAGTLAFLSRSASSHPSSSRYGYRGPDSPGPGGEEIKGKKMTMLTRGASFRRQGSSGMTWADNWIFTDDGMFLGRHSKVADDSGTSTSLHAVAHDLSKKARADAASFSTVAELQRSQSVGSVGSRERKQHTRTRSHHRSGMWGFKWLKKNFRKAFR